MLEVLSRLYAPLIAIVALGWWARRTLPPPVLRYVGPEALGRFLFRIGIPVGLIGFLHRTDLPTAVAWVLPPIVVMAIGLGWGLAWLWMRILPISHRWSRQRQGSFQLAAMMGNTGYIGYPVCLAIAGPSYFGWAVLYDILGTVIGNYGLGVWLANRHGRGAHLSQTQMLRQLTRIPALWGFVIGLSLRPVPFPSLLDTILLGAAWSVVGLSLIAIGMRMGQLQGWHSINTVSTAIAIKLLALPVAVGLALSFTGIEPMARLIVTLQAGMPSAFSTLILAEEYELDRETSVAAIAGSSILLLLTLPIWLLIWG